MLSCSKTLKKNSSGHLHVWCTHGLQASRFLFVFLPHLTILYLLSLLLLCVFTDYFTASSLSLHHQYHPTYSVCRSFISFSISAHFQLTPSPSPSPFFNVHTHCLHLLSIHPLTLYLAICCLFTSLIFIYLPALILHGS